MSETPKNPVPTVDVVIEVGDGIVLIERKNPPEGWALPGGFVDYGEPLAEAARREAREETCLEVELYALLGCYSDPKRDARGHTISAVFVGRAQGTPTGADDAARAAVFREAELPRPIVFDHPTILADYFAWKKSGRLPPLDR